MANADDILKSVQRCLEYISQKKTPSSPLLKYLDEVRNKLSCRDTPLNEQPNECFNVFATNLLHLWNATLYQNDFFNDVIIFEVIFKLMSFFSFEELSLNQPDYMSLYEGNHWLKIKSKIAIKYSQLLLSNHEYTTAESSLKFAIKQTNSLMDQLNCQIKEICGPSSEYDQLLADCHNDLLVCETYQIETMAAVGNYEEAKKVLENLQAINNQTVNSYLAALCYNIGLDLYKLHLFEASTYWLQQSFKYGNYYIQYMNSFTRFHVNSNKP